MKLTLEQSDFHAALQKLAKVVKSKSTTPITQNVLITADNDRVKITGTNLDIEASVVIPASVEVGGETTLPYHLLANTVAKYQKGGIVSLKAADSQAEISCGRSRGKIQTLPAQDFPVMASNEYQSQFDVAGDVMDGLFGKVAFAASTEEARYYLNGVYLTRRDGKLAAVATDGHRLALSVSDMAIADDVPSVIVPNETVAALAFDGASDVTVSVSQTKIRFETDWFTLVSKVVDGSYPNYERVIPTVLGSECEFSGQEFRAALDRVALEDQRDNAVKLTFTPDGVQLDTKSSMAEKSDFVDGKLDGDQVEIGFNRKYLSSAVARVGGSVLFQVGNATSPGIIKDSADDGWLTVVMPMRV